MSKRKGFVGGLLVGGFIGSIVAILFAPDSGKKTREWVKKTVDENQDRIEDVKRAAEETSEKVVKGAKNAKAIVEEKISELKQFISKKEGGE